MRIRNILQNAIRPSLQNSSWDYKIALSLSIIIAMGSIANLAYYIGYADGIKEAGKPILDFHVFLIAIHVWISIGSVIYIVSFFFKNLISWGISILSLVWVCCVYIWWHLEKKDYLLNTLELREGTDRYLQYSRSIGMLRGATQWDILILGIVIILILWQIRILPDRLKVFSKTHTS
jgi:hypothetical protein